LQFFVQNGYSVSSPVELGDPPPYLETAEKGIESL
jgi:hypothetical protein